MVGVAAIFTSPWFFLMIIKLKFHNTSYYFFFFIIMQIYSQFKVKVGCLTNVQYIIYLINIGIVMENISFEAVCLIFLYILLEATGCTSHLIWFSLLKGKLVEPMFQDCFSHLSNNQTPHQSLTMFFYQLLWKLIPALPFVLIL